MTQLGVGLFALLAWPPCVRLLESQLVLQMVVQMPLLAVSGYLAARPLLRERNPRWNDNGLPGLIVAISVGMVWMLPRSMDAALASGAVEIAKFVSLPLLVGAPLAASWSRAGPIARGFVLARLALLGWLYAAAPVRVCNYYLASDQPIAAAALFAAAALLGLGLGARLLFGPGPDAVTSPTPPVLPAARRAHRALAADASSAPFCR
jgi:hypothetical protein